MKTRYIVYAILVIGLGALVTYRITKNKDTEASDKGVKGGAAKAPTVDAVVVKIQDFSNKITVTGSIEANEQVQIRPEVQGLIKSIDFNEGTTVSRGQRLIKIDDSELRAQLAQAVTRENLAGETEERARQLFAKEAISREEHDQALADYKALKAQTQLIRAQIAKTEIRAPFSGRIGLREVSLGDYVSPTNIIASLVSSDPVKITFTVPEKYASMLKNGSAIRFSVSGSDKKYDAKIYAIEPRIDETTRTLQLRAKAPNPTGNLIPGSFASIDLPLTTINNAILIPTQAVIPVQDGKQVLVSKNGLVKEVRISTTTRTDSSVIVTEGLQNGDTVITTGLMTLKEGSKVKPQVKKNTN